MTDTIKKTGKRFPARLGHCLYSRTGRHGPCPRWLDVRRMARDGWRATFSDIKNSARRETFDYYTGIGHRKNGKPAAPFAADVLHSLILDSSGADRNFSDWCADYGYDADSLRAFNTYQECCNNAKRMRQVFTQEQTTALSDILQDY